MTIAPAAIDPPSPRLISLDALRGLTVALMILVNNAGDGDLSYAQLRHSRWNGCTLTDLVFPTFLFIVGASIALAFGNRLARGTSRRHILGLLLRRSLLIFALGLLLNAIPSFHLADLRIYGVLQRIALCYALAGLIYLAGSRLRLPSIHAPAVVAAATAALSLAVYAWLLTRVPVPGFGLPGVDIPLLDPVGNLAAWLDRSLLPAAHLYHHSFYDPEGLLSTLAALANTLLGLLAGLWLLTHRSIRQRALALALAGAALLVIGLLWAQTLPLNKRLWTSSYALFSAGIAALAWALLFWLIDGPLKLRRGLYPWLVFGTNALTAYILSEVLAIALAAIPFPFPVPGNLQQALFHLIPRWLGPPPFLSLLYSGIYVAVCLLPVLALYRRGIFLKI